MTGCADLCAGHLVYLASYKRAQTNATGMKLMQYTVFVYLFKGSGLKRAVDSISLGYSPNPVKYLPLNL